MNGSPERLAELLASYRRTHYGVALPGGISATLHIGAPAPRPVATWIGADGFAVYLTACNPHSEPLPAAENEARLTELRQCLRADGARWLEGRGAIPGEPWCETSLLATGLPLGRLDALARNFRQNACVHVRAGAPSRLRLYRPDWRGRLDAADDLEWGDG